MEQNTHTNGATGYVYVLKNKCFKEPWLQIGNTEESLESALLALSHELPHDFEVVYTAQSAEHEYITERVHEALSEFRVEPERRFFLVSEEHAVESVREVLVDLDSRPPAQQDTHADDGLHLGDANEDPDAGHQSPPRDQDAPPDTHTETPPNTELHAAGAVPASTDSVEIVDAPGAKNETDAPPESASLDPYLVTDFGYLYIIKPAKRVQVTARVAFGITTLGPKQLIKECRALFGLNPRQLQLIYYGWLESSHTAEQMIHTELGRFASRRKQNFFRCPLSWVAECAFQVPGLLNDYRFLRIALGRWARYYDRTPFHKALEKRAKRGELERERQDFDVEQSVIEARLGQRVRPLVLEEFPPGWKPKKVDHGFDLNTGETHHGFDTPSP